MCVSIESRSKMFGGISRRLLSGSIRPTHQLLLQRSSVRAVNLPNRASPPPTARATPMRWMCRGLATAAASPKSSALLQPQTSGAASAKSGGGDSESPYSIQGSFLSGRSIYMDMQATTPVDPRVLDAMLPFYTEQFGNPHSRTHHFGWESEAAVEKARENVASLIGVLRTSGGEADAKELIFTSGATESNNAAIKGVARFYKQKKKHIITTQIEHKCVLDSCRVLQTEGFDVTYLPVQKSGLIDLNLLEKSIRPDTALISVMFVNNEIGVIQPIKEIGALARKHKVLSSHPSDPIPIRSDPPPTDH